MVRILCIGDSHIPVRVKDLPSQIYDKLNQLTHVNLFDYTLFTGDLITFPSLIDFLEQKTKKDLFKVIGNMDYHYGERKSPTYQKLDILFEGNIKISIGLTHGAQINPRGDLDQLEFLSQEKGFNILVSGHTHKEEVHLTNNGILLLNPGSVTGAWSFLATGNPSFIELSINVMNYKILVRLFQLERQLKTILESKFNFIAKNNKIYKNF
ncbi:MAG: YfcE family phosphodiesterase [Promethearchaeota archaeon]